MNERFASFCHVWTVLIVLHYNIWNLKGEKQQSAVWVAALLGQLVWLLIPQMNHLVHDPAWRVVSWMNQGVLRYTTIDVQNAWFGVVVGKRKLHSALLLDVWHFKCKSARGLDVVLVAGQKEHFIVLCTCCSYQQEKFVFCVLFMTPFVYLNPMDDDFSCVRISSSHTCFDSKRQTIIVYELMNCHIYLWLETHYNLNKYVLRTFC